MGLRRHLNVRLRLRPEPCWPLRVLVGEAERFERAKGVHAPRLDCIRRANRLCFDNPSRRLRVGRSGVDAHGFDRCFDLSLRHRPSARSFHARERAIAKLRSEIGLRESKDACCLREVINDGDHRKIPTLRVCASWESASGVCPRAGCVVALDWAGLCRSSNRAVSQSITSLRRYRRCRPIRA